jgi:hypothetical protein
MIINFESKNTFSTLPEDLFEAVFFVIEVQIDFSFCGRHDGSF